MKATLVFPNNKEVRYDSEMGGWPKEFPDDRSEMAVREAMDEFSDPRQQIDYLIKQFRVKVKDAVPPEPLPKGAIA